MPVAEVNGVNIRYEIVAGADLPVMGVTADELASLKMPVIVIPGNDKTHSSASGRAAHRMIPGSVLHELPISDRDVPLIMFEEWRPCEEEIARTFADFMAKLEIPRDSV